MELVVYLKNDQDLAVLEPLLKRMKLRFDTKNGNGKKVPPQLPPRPSSKKEENLTDRVKELRAQLPPPPSKEKRAAALARMDELRKQGLDVSAYGDPIEWQRETRKDRKLPFRDDD